MNPDIAAALIADSHINPSRVVDFLLEYEVPLVEVLLMFAGNPPDWSDGLAQGCLAEWLARQVPPDGRAKVLIPELACVDNYPLDPSWYTRFAADVQIGKTFTVQEWRTEAAACRYLKRRVLSLFGEVTYLVDTGSAYDPNGVYRSATFNQALARFRYDLKDKYPIQWTESKLRYVQMLPAPDWVPSHEEERIRDQRLNDDIERQILGDVTLTPEDA